MGNPFFDFVNYGPKRSKKIENSNYIELYEKNAFRFDFGPQGSAPTGKQALSLSCVFRFGHFLRSKIESESIFLIKYYLITILKKMDRFGL